MSVNPTLNRRAVVAGACGTACVAALSACASYAPGPAAPAPAPAPAEPAPVGGATPAPSGGAPLASTADIPVGGGTVFAQQGVVVTQPAEGEFRGFSAECTHQGCMVDEVADGTINCPCHGSRFAVEDGAVVDGPAGSALPERAVEVQGDSVMLV